MDAEILTLKQVADELGLTTKEVRRLAIIKKIPGYMVSGRLLFDRRDVEEYKAKNEN